MTNKEVQELYDQYKLMRDRTEFTAVGRQQEFDQLFKSLPVAIAAPTITKEGTRVHVKYAAVPEDFVPTIGETPSSDVQEIYYEMKKAIPGSLRSVRIVPCCEVYVLMPPDIRIKFNRDMMQARMVEKAFQLTCEYVSDRAGALTAKIYWYKSQPPVAADANALRSRLPNHPLLSIGDAREVCPKTFAEAK